MNLVLDGQISSDTRHTVWEALFYSNEKTERFGSIR